MPSVRGVVPFGLAATVAVALMVGAGVAVRTPPAVTAVAPERLPDLDQETPSELEIREHVSGGQRSYLLGFRSAVRNIGDGPLIVEGHRRDTSSRDLTVDQIIERPGQPQELVPAVGRMRYAISPDHRHWHYLEFEHYQLQRSELRRAGSSDLLVEDHKTGFCLGDRYRVPTPVPPATPLHPVYTGRCGLSDPDLLRVRSGISVGYGDAYSAYLEGQELPLDSLTDGRYVLVHRVNVDGRLHELSYENNAASVLFDLQWRGGKPYIRVLATCPDTARCDEQVQAPSGGMILELPLNSAVSTAASAASATVAAPIHRADAALAQAVSAFDAHQPGKAISALLVVKSNVVLAHQQGMAQIGKAPADPESDDAPGPPAVMAVLSLEHRVDLGVVALFAGKRGAEVVDTLRLLLRVTHARRTAMLDKIISLPPEGSGGDYADGMADTLGSYTKEVQQLTTALSTYRLTSAARLGLTNALSRVRATKAKVDAAYGGGE